MSHVDPLVVPVPDGVSCGAFIEAVGGFIGLKCNSHRSTTDELNRNVYVAEVKFTDNRSHVAVINVSNLVDEEATALAAFMRAYHKDACILCAADLPAHPNSASPIIDGKCCDACNQQHVVPFRMFSVLSARYCNRDDCRH